jgi:hypothetical protein
MKEIKARKNQKKLKDILKGEFNPAHQGIQVVG